MLQQQWRANTLLMNEKKGFTQTLTEQDQQPLVYIKSHIFHKLLVQL